MVEKLRFNGVDEVVVVNLCDQKTFCEAAGFAFYEHRPVLLLDSDDRLSVSELFGKIGEHWQSCGDCRVLINQKLQMDINI